MRFSTQLDAVRGAVHGLEQSWRGEHVPRAGECVVVAIAGSGEPVAFELSVVCVRWTPAGEPHVELGPPPEFRSIADWTEHLDRRLSR